MKVLLLIIYSASMLVSCGIQKESKLNSNNVRAGMTKEQVISLVGSPYKSGFHYNEDNDLVDEFYYKEIIAKNYTTYEMITLLTFINDRLKTNVLVSDFEVDISSHSHK